MEGPLFAVLIVILFPPTIVHSRDLQPRSPGISDFNHQWINGWNAVFSVFCKYFLPEEVDLGISSNRR